MTIRFTARQLKTGRPNELLLYVEDHQAEVLAFLQAKRREEKAAGRQERLAVELTFEPAAVPPVSAAPAGSGGPVEAVVRVFGGTPEPAGIQTLRALAQEAEAEGKTQARPEQPVPPGKPQGELFPQEQQRQGNLYIPPY